MFYDFWQLENMYDIATIPNMLAALSIFLFLDKF